LKINGQNGTDGTVYFDIVPFTHRNLEETDPGCRLHRAAHIKFHDGNRSGVEDNRIVPFHRKIIEISHRNAIGQEQMGREQKRKQKHCDLKFSLHLDTSLTKIGKGEKWGDAPKMIP
jgi:hypothetical protein